ncbi:hypothetical protein HYV83_05170 [Candidatus Woesearchaeota archaeon]|nr:hypothetical protein [Candidatus Woesearchaeota archaeon]
MQSLTPEQERNDGLIAKGNELYGRSFSQIHLAFSALQPFMTDVAGCLEALVNQQRWNRTHQKEKIEQVGYTLADILAKEALWAQHQANKHRAIRIGPEAIGDLVRDAFTNHGFAKHPMDRPSHYSERWHSGMSSMQGSQSGNGPYTGQTEQPGSNPGYSRRSIPHPDRPS